MPQTSESAGFQGSGVSPTIRNSGGSAFLWRVEEGVDPVGIGLEPLLRPRRQRRKAAFGLAVEAEGANEPVDAEAVGAEDLGQAALSDPAR